MTRRAATSIPDLIKRVEGATSGNYFLDEELHIALGNPERGMFDPPDVGEEVAHSDTGHVWKVNRSREGYFSSIPFPKYSLSTDAALALVERVLPGQWAEILRAAQRTLSERHRWHIAPAKAEQMRELPLAIILALLRALQHEDSK